MRRLYLPVFAVVILCFLLVGYTASSVSVGNEARGEFNFLFEVNSSPRVVVQLPYSLTLSSGIYPGENTEEDFENALKKETAEALGSSGLYPEFRSVEPLVLLPGEKPPERIAEPLIIFFVPFYGHEENIYYESCYASVLVYMSSRGDVGSYLSVEEKYSGDSTKTDDLKYFASDLFDAAMKAAESGNGSHSLKVVYWNVLEVRRGRLAGGDCWDILAEEIGKEIAEWARTLNP
ncbi:hypothetical protein [Thermococcus sp. 21S7]|uniref:hypothetical protein n=1 Tax=Thermococcus sp. 21S7 TaxID=1638221 RepID=UPI001438886B|nr:hypothetical protein [Thermococcus sp. 21S7]NJE60951.1 hypothetical protein [Thermococcus sp. 21S7]